MQRNCPEPLKLQRKQGLWRFLREIYQEEKNYSTPFSQNTTHGSIAFWRLLDYAECTGQARLA